MIRTNLSRVAFSLVAVATLAAAGSALGPPQLTVREVTGAPPTPGAVLEVAVKFHPDHGAPELSARKLTMHNGVRLSTPLVVLAASTAGHFGVARQWETGAPALIIVTLEQGEGRAVNSAEAMVKVNADGKVTGITHALGSNIWGDRSPRAFRNAEIDQALAEM